ncbi:coiled-coil domain-containing protein 42 homolog [Leucoraja erinacea]|uniref:coiled-coil domain-containing protein 42 homolog n=1 Tax=Leucoraja erinaceus TaxID=7782 RepID=UPI00245841AC|nr:coiled-coil domain-containing protein 42 homolog [Leucoraja erinacea]
MMSAGDASILSLLAAVRRQPLHIKNTMKNIFVTQLGDRRDEDEDVKYIPIIKEPAAEILARDFRTPQSTLVLKKEVEVDQVNAELADKREEFLQRMDAITQKRAEFERKELANKERVLKFDRFIKENEAKTCRAIKKHQLEVKENRMKRQELQDLLKQFEVVKARQQKLQKRVSNNKLYEDYLTEVVDNLPENYLDYGVESLVMSIIQKYETHQSTNETLIINLTRLSDELEQQQHNLEAVHQEYDTSKLMMTSQLSQLRMECDEMKEKNKRMEQKINLHRGHFIQQSEEVGALLLAINNLAEQCHAKHYGILEEMSILTKLDMVKEFIMEKKTISQMAVHINSTTVTGSSDQTQNKPGVTNWMKPQTNTLLVNSNKLIAQQKNRKKQTNSNAR